MADNPYGAEHQKRRAELLPLAIGTPCPRCGVVMLDSDELDLGHTVDLVVDRHAVGDRIEHASCNRSAGGALKARRDRYRHSRNW
ncbi:MAG: hypothetical protein ACTMIY_13605 [Microbacterium gubbeenense]